MSKLRVMLVVSMFFASAMGAWSQKTVPLEFLQSVPLPELNDTDFDHFGVDLYGHRLFLAAGDHPAVGVFDLRTNKLIHIITEVKEPHTIIYRGELKKLFVNDASPAECKIYQGDSFNPVGTMKLEEGAGDYATYDPTTKHMFVTSGGQKAHLFYSLINVVDTTSDKRLADIKIDSNHLGAIALEKSGPRLFVNEWDKNAVGVIDRGKGTMIATWSIAQEAQENVVMAFDEADHRLFIVTRKPAKILVLDSDSGKLVMSLPCVDHAGDAFYDPRSKRIYVSGFEFIDVFQERDADHYVRIGHIPGASGADNGILVPQLNRYYIAVPRQEHKTAELRVYKVLP